MDSWRSSLLVTLIWALLYLPGLPGPEFKGEEPRRAIVAREMLESGDWLQPHIAGERYEAKPPLFNWLIATSWSIGGRQNEALARLPSALAMLALALTLLAVLQRMVDPQVGLFSALLVLLNPAGLDKGWLAEIDPFYSACFGVSLLAWLLGGRRGGWGRWLLFAGSGLALAAGILAKGPVPILWFLLPFWLVGPVAEFGGRLRLGWREGRLRGWCGALGVEVRAVLAPSRWLRVLGEGTWLVLFLGLGLSLPWYLWAAGQRGDGAAGGAEAAGQGGAAATWRHELLERLRSGGGGWNPLGGLKVAGEGLLAFLPWTLLLLPLFVPVWRSRLQLGRQRERFVVRWSAALALAFLPIALLPGGNGRYLMPLLAPMAMIVAIAYGAPTVWERLPLLRRSWTLLLRVLVVGGWVIWAAALLSVLALHAERLGPELGFLALALVSLLLARKLVARLADARRWTTLVTATAFVAAGLVGSYCFARPHWFAGEDSLRAMAARIDEGREPGQPIQLYRFDFKGDEGWLFYLDGPRRNSPDRSSVRLRGDDETVLLVTSARRWQADRDFLFTRLGEPRRVSEFRATPETRRAWVKVEFGPERSARTWAVEARQRQAAQWWTEPALQGGEPGEAGSADGSEGAAPASGEGAEPAPGL